MKNRIPIEYLTSKTNLNMQPVSFYSLCFLDTIILYCTFTQVQGLPSWLTQKQ